MAVPLQPAGAIFEMREGSVASSKVNAVKKINKLIPIPMMDLLLLAEPLIIISMIIPCLPMRIFD